MNIKCFPTGLFDSNCYVVDNNNECVIIDAGVPSNTIIDYVKSKNLSVKYILLTHGHIDHICNVNELKDATNAPIVIHQKDSNMLTEPDLNLSSKIMGPKGFYKSDVSLGKSSNYTFGDITVTHINTPGHTEGGVCYKIDNSLFTGDTLFKSAIGRTDLPGGSLNQILSSIKDNLFSLNDDIVVYPGHGPSSSIGFEKKHNPFLT